MKTNVNDFLKDLITNKMRGNEYTVHITEKFDTKNLDAEKWLNTISTEGYKYYKKTEIEDSAPQARALQKLNKIAKNVRIESGHLLASLFVNVAVVRDKTVTETVDGIEMEDFTRNPYDFDYNISADTMKKTLQEAWEYGNEIKTPKLVVCAVATRNSSQQAPPCPACKEGYVVCEKCNGTGKGELYVEDTYATGVERMKAGQCPNCLGKGKIKCVECNGSGKQSMFSNQHQVVKKFEDSKELRSFACISTSWEHAERCSNYSGEYLDERVYPDDFQSQDLKSGIDKLYKNQKEILLDANLTLPNEISEECQDLYEQNKKEAWDYFEENDEGKLGCSIEKHFAIPMFRLCFSANADGEGDREYALNIYKLSDKGTCCFDLINFPMLGFFKSLFT